MEPDQNQERQQAHALLDMLPDEKLAAVRSLLQVMVEPLSRSLAAAPVDKEEITSETAAALQRSSASAGLTNDGGGSPDWCDLGAGGSRRSARHRSRNRNANSSLRRSLSG